jgi:Domain of unknown function (DUF4440)
MKIARILLGATAMAFFTAPAFAAMTAAEKSAVAYEETLNKIYVSKDVKGMDAILSDDWMGQDDSGRMTKAQFMAGFKAGDMTATSIVNQNVTARAVGDVVIVQGGDIEKSAYKGKDTSGTYNWTDILVNKNGKLVSIASQVTKLKAPAK